MKVRFNLLAGKVHQASCGPTPRSQTMADNNDEQLLNMIKELSLESLTLQSVCAFLLAQAALGNSQPREFLGTTTSFLMGQADGLAARSGNTEKTAAMTATIERICSMAETLCANPEPEPRRKRR
jgi:hypothetical protein